MKLTQTRQHLLLLLFFSLAIYFFGNGGLVITDPVESNYVETAKEMLAAGDYLSPRIYGNYWYDKPILFYLELIAAFKLFGITDFAARFAPAVMSTLGLYLTYAFTRHLYSAKLGLITALLLGTSVEYYYIGHAVITDMTLFVAISATLMAFYLGYAEKRPLWYLAAFLSAGIATLAKGPLGLCLPGLIILIFLLTERDLKALANRYILIGFLLYLATIATWYYPMYLKHGSDFLNTFFGVHNALRVTVSEHPRDDVWFYYLLVFVAGCLPWSLLGLPAAWRRLKACWQNRRLPWPQAMATRFCLIWALTVFCIFQCFATKYVTYTMPYLVPLALLVAPFFTQRPKLLRRGIVGMTIFYLIGTTAIAPYFMRYNSAKDVANLLNTAVPADTLVLTYRTPYPVSLSYYSAFVPKRLEPASVIREIRPDAQAISWNSTNIMPMLAIEDLPQDKPIIVITDSRYVEDMHANLPLPLQELGQIGSFLLFTYQP